MAGEAFRMDGRVALVTGGSRGLGLAMAQAFAGAGARVAILARRRAQLDEALAGIAAAGGKATGHLCDVAAKDDIARAWGEVLAQHGQVDILVNNAGGAATGPFESISDETWQHDFDLKLFAAIRFCRLALPEMRKRRWGRAVNVLNVFAKAPPADTAPTSVTRAAGLALTKVLANEYAPHNVLVNALLVGFIESDQMHNAHARSGANVSYADFIDRMARQQLKIGIGRIGRAEEFAQAALFLCSDAGSYIAGVALNVDGGYSPVM